MAMRTRSFMLTLMLLLLAGTAGAPQASSQVVAAYTNQSNSTLYIENVASNGLMTGFYINRASGFQCQNTPYPVTGWILGRAISFTVVWKNTAENCQSVTGWTGFFSADFSTITTNWLLAVSGGTTIGRGQDTFRRTAARTSESLLAPGTSPQN
ncbi:MAG TPA: avidin/streptavidin family protein [Longimicrobium sp.]|nr:avidin/streptavidin family protein [Longimicrobium sp.]